MKTAVVAGHICLDVIPGFEHHVDLVPGRLLECGAPTLATGGAVSNTGMTMHLLGAPVTLMGKVGNDQFGDTVRQVVARRAPGLERGMTVAPGAITSYTVVVNIPGIDRIFLHCPGANADFTSRDVDWSLASQSDLFHFGYPCFMKATYDNEGAELKAMYRKAKEAGMTTSMDPGMPDPNGPAGKVDWKRLLSEVLPDTDLFLPSADELLYMLRPDKFGEGDNLSVEELHSLGDEMIAMGAAVATVKLGSRGMYVRSASAGRIAAMGKARPDDVEAWADREFIFPVFRPTEFKGATGAGDSAIGAFLVSLLRGLPLREAGLMAAAVGASNVEAPDSLSGIRSWEETTARVAAGWTRTHLELVEPGWSLGDDGVWQH
ncbi:MAG: carbohydrate kinase family protein [Victivallales bacterium]|nr:carbohydrate kinase family protein [Victivallales bacterium]